MKEEIKTKRKISLVPFPIIMMALNGEPDALNAVLCHYHNYIMKSSEKRLRDEYGNVYYFSDEHISKEIKLKLLAKIMQFQII